MEDRACPACKSQNEEDASYCDQCGQPLSAPEPGGEGQGVCGRCGLELVAAPDEPCCGGAPAGTPERLAAMILEKTTAGASLKKAVEEACREVLKTSELAAPPREPAEPRACPLCGEEGSSEGPQCSGCGLSFQEHGPTGPCPRCEDDSAVDGKCRCGAILTLSRLLEYVENSVRFICLRCKQPYAVARSACPDCGGELIAAERIKAYAQRLAAEQA